MDSQFHIANLISKSLKGEISKEEQQFLDTWKAADESNKILFEKITDNEQLLQQVDLYQQFDKKKSWQAIESEIAPTKTIKLSPTRYLRYAAAILLPLCVSLGLIYYFLMTPQVDAIAEIDKTIVPGTQKAILTLADGGTLELQGEQAPTSISQGKTRVKNTGQSLEYNEEPTSENTNNSLAYNELRTPNGGQYEVKLSDGSVVKLNAGSSLKYPVNFPEDSVRKVFLTGEAYFEVTHTGSSFVVVSEAQDIRVLGTIFNVSAYENESTVATTLVEGKVQIETGETKQLLKPGEQSLLQKSTSGLSVSEVNTSQYTSWIRGKFEFNHDNMELVIKRLARWYDFDYEFENEEAKKFHFTGRVDNSQPISTILQMLEVTSGITFQLKENTITIQ